MHISPNRVIRKQNNEQGEKGMNIKLHKPRKNTIIDFEANDLERKKESEKSSEYAVSPQQGTTLLLLF